MLKSILRIVGFLLFVIFNSNNLFAEIIKDIKVSGNERISKQTIILFSKAKTNTDVDEEDLNLYCLMQTLSKQKI